MGLSYYIRINFRKWLAAGMFHKESYLVTGLCAQSAGTDRDVASEL